MAIKASNSITIASINDVASTTRYYLLQSSTLATPSKPTTSPPSSSWTSTEPTYTEGSTNSLYFTDETIFSDSTFYYSDVSLSTSYEAAKIAYNKAVAAGTAASKAQDTADSKTKTYQQASAPTDASEGDTWIDTYVPYPSDTLYPGDDTYPGSVGYSTTYCYDGSEWVKVKSASTANAQATADTAQALATAINNYFSSDTDGAHVGTVEGNPNSGLNLLLAAAMIALRDGTTDLMTIAADLIELGKNSTSAKITMCGGTASLYANLISDALGSAFVIDSAAGVQLLGTDCSIGAGNVGSDDSGIERGIIMTGPYIYIVDGDGREGTFELSKLYDLLNT
jgi:hypothetical protein